MHQDSAIADSGCLASDVENRVFPQTNDKIDFSANSCDASYDRYFRSDVDLFHVHNDHAATNACQNDISAELEVALLYQWSANFRQHFLMILDHALTQGNPLVWSQ